MVEKYGHLCRSTRTRHIQQDQDLDGVDLNGECTRKTLGREIQNQGRINDMGNIQGTKRRTFPCSRSSPRSTTEARNHQTSKERKNRRLPRQVRGTCRRGEPRRYNCHPSSAKSNTQRAGDDSSPSTIQRPKWTRSLEIQAIRHHTTRMGTKPGG